MINKGKKSLFVAIDGSEESKQAFLQSTEFFDSEEFFIYICHLSDSSKIYHKKEYKPTYIYEDYRRECLAKFPRNKFQLIFQEKDEEEKTIRKQILKLAETYKPSSLFMGFVGRKGKKEDSSLIGQTARNLTYLTKTPLFLGFIKPQTKTLVQRENRSANGFNFLVCLDGSEKSYEALLKALDFGDKDGDKIFTCFAPNKDMTETHSTIFETRINEIEEDYSQKKVKFFPLEKSTDPNKTILEFILSNKDQIPFDWIVVGSHGIRAQYECKQYLGRTAEFIIRYSPNNVILIP